MRSYRGPASIPVKGDRPASAQADRQAIYFYLHIAAQARSQGLVLVTNNVSEFARVPGLMVENWVAASQNMG
jgi:tRNA(fMet)-specific endonuclease VapC